MISLDEEALTEALTDILPKSQHSKIQRIIDAVKDQDVLAYSVVSNPAHIEYSQVEYGRGSVGLGASGNLVRATLGDAGEEWEVEC